jgi:hypothetical protein
LFVDCGWPLWIIMVWCHCGRGLFVDFHVNPPNGMY